MPDFPPALLSNDCFTSLIADLPIAPEPTKIEPQDLGLEMPLLATPTLLTELEGKLPAKGTPVAARIPAPASMRHLAYGLADVVIRKGEKRPKDMFLQVDSQCPTETIQWLASFLKGDDIETIVGRRNERKRRGENEVPFQTAPYDPSILVDRILLSHEHNWLESVLHFPHFSVSHKTPSLSKVGWRGHSPFSYKEEQVYCLSLFDPAFVLGRTFHFTNIPASSEREHMLMSVQILEALRSILVEKNERLPLIYAPAPEPQHDHKGEDIYFFMPKHIAVQLVKKLSQYNEPVRLIGDMPKIDASLSRG